MSRSAARPTAAAIAMEAANANYNAKAARAKREADGVDPRITTPSTTTSKSTAKKEPAMTKSTTATETNTQRLARLQRAAIGTRSMADKANTAFRKALEMEISEGRIAATREKAATAMEIANKAAKEAKEKTPYSVNRTLSAIEASVLKERAAANPQPEPEPVAKPKAVKAEPRSKRVVLHRVELINRADGSVDGHKAGCRDIAKVAKAERIDRSGVQQVSSKHAAWLDYNGDFLAEAEGHEACAENDECAHGWSINWLPCADGVPEFDTAAPKPAKAAVKKAAAVASPAKPKASPVTADSKANALRDYLNAAGWTAEVLASDPQVIVKAERGGEQLVTTFIDGKLDLQAMPLFTRTDGSSVRLRNVSAVKKQADADATARPVKAQRSVATRTKVVTAETEAAEATRGLALDLKSCEVDDLQKHLADTTIWWRLSTVNGGGVVEARVWKVTRLQSTPSGRCMEFIEAVQTKRGWTAGPIRTVALKRVRLA